MNIDDNVPGDGRARPDKIVSGGQTGVDRAALDVAIFLEIEQGGWCPRGRRSQDGPIDSIYNLRETDSYSYSERTEKNVIDSDATLVIYRGELTGGTRLTVRLARKHRRPLLLVDLDEDSSICSVRQINRWIIEQNVHVLNVAGPREESSPGIGQAVSRLLSLAWR